MRHRIPWNKIDVEILSGATAADVANRYEISINSIKSHIKREKLMEKRELSEKTGNLVSILDDVGSKAISTELKQLLPVLVKSDPRLNFTRRCDACNISKVCSHSSEGAECEISAPIKADTSEDLIHIVQTIVSLETDRILQAIAEEKLTGTIGFNLDISEAQLNLLKMIKLIRDMSDNRDEIVIKARGQGILSKLFGVGNKAEV